MPRRTRLLEARTASAVWARGVLLSNYEYRYVAVHLGARRRPGAGQVAKADPDGDGGRLGQGAPADRQARKPGQGPRRVRTRSWLKVKRRNGAGREARTEHPAIPCSSVWSRATTCFWESSRGSHVPRADRGACVPYVPAPRSPLRPDPVLAQGQAS